jgi:hypothetical protein
MSWKRSIIHQEHTLHQAFLIFQMKSSLDVNQDNPLPNKGSVESRKVSLGECASKKSPPSLTASSALSADRRPCRPVSSDDSSRVAESANSNIVMKE